MSPSASFSTQSQDCRELTRPDGPHSARRPNRLSPALGIRDIALGVIIGAATVMLAR
jgi:hypothetical protein